MGKLKIIRNFAYTEEWTWAVTIPLIYDFCDNFHDGLACVTQNEKIGFINQKGEQVIPLSSQYNNWEFGSFDNGICMVLSKRIGGINEKQKIIGYIDKKGTQYWED